MRTYLLLLGILAMNYTSWSQATDTILVTPGGMPYNLFWGNGARQVRSGDYIKIRVTQKINDSIYFTTKGGLPNYLQVNTPPQPYDISEIWTSLKVGDSVITIQLVDTFIKRMPDQVPPNFKNGDKIICHIKLIEIFETDSLTNADYEREKKEWLEKEIATIGQFLASKDINAHKTPSGAFVQMIKPGAGNLVDSGATVIVNYTGTSFVSGNVIDSNTDPAFGHVEPLSFSAGEGVMIKGFDEAVLMMRKGATARVYIPSMLAYAGQPPSAAIKPYDILIYDIEIVDIKEK